MKRREFITVIGGAAAWPLAARAQQGERTRRIGVLVPLSAAAFAPFFRELGQNGFVEGENLVVASPPDERSRAAERRITLGRLGSAGDAMGL
jgi:hypothetical protein